MPVNQLTKLETIHKFDSQKCRHYVEESNYVLHCHHYSALITQLAMDSDDLWNGTRLLKESSEDSFKGFFDSYFSSMNDASVQEKVSIGEQYYSFCGLGNMKIQCAGENSGEVILETSHIDQGWIKKWGETNKAVNFITCGFISAWFSSVFGQGREYDVREEESIVRGSKQSRFVIYKK